MKSSLSASLSASTTGERDRAEAAAGEKEEWPLTPLEGDLEGDLKSFLAFFMVMNRHVVLGVSPCVSRILVRSRGRHCERK